jgi:hypothetical protein
MSQGASMSKRMETASTSRTSLRDFGLDEDKDDSGLPDSAASLRAWGSTTGGCRVKKTSTSSSLGGLGAEKTTCKIRFAPSLESDGWSRLKCHGEQ